MQIARALMTDPELMLLDEPAAGLDLGGREDLVRRLGALAADLAAPALVLVTHHVEEIPPDFTDVLLLREGAIVAQGPVETTLTAENLERTFGLPLELEVRGNAMPPGPLSAQGTRGARLTSERRHRTEGEADGLADRDAWLGWVGIALVLAAVEAATVDFVFIMLAGGALAGGVAAALGAPFFFQVVVAVVASLLLLLVVRPHAQEQFTDTLTDHHIGAAGLRRPEAWCPDRHRDRRPDQARRARRGRPGSPRAAAPPAPATSARHRDPRGDRDRRPPRSSRPPPPPDPAPHRAPTEGFTHGRIGPLIVLLLLALFVDHRARAHRADRAAADRPHHRAAGPLRAHARGRPAPAGPVRRLVRANIDQREQVVNFPPQPVITSDNLVVSIDTVIYFQVIDPK